VYSDVLSIKTIFEIEFHIVIHVGLGLEMPVPSQGHYGCHSFPVVD
jgi:hypothetical protein